MKALIYRYGSICEPDVMAAIRRLSIDLEEETTEIYNKSMLPSDCVKLMRDRMINRGYSFVFTINFFPWLSDLCNVVGVVYISLIVDSPVLELYSNSIANPCNRVFLFDNELYKEFSHKNPGHIFHIPLASDVARCTKTINDASASLRRKWQSDVSFIGSLYTEKCPYNSTTLPEFENGYANGLIESQLKIYGYNFLQEVISDEFVNTFIKSSPNFYRFPPNCEENNKAVVAQQYLSMKVAEQERVRALTMLAADFNVDIYTGSDTSSIDGIHNRGFARSLEDMPLIFNQSKINLNITAKSIRSGISLRVFDVLACGGFLITNYQAELPDYFTIGEDLVTYSSLDELHELVAYYLEHDDERQAIAAHGYETVCKYHDYNTRMLQIFDMAFPAK